MLVIILRIWVDYFMLPDVNKKKNKIPNLVRIHVNGPDLASKQ